MELMFANDKLTEHLEKYLHENKIYLIEKYDTNKSCIDDNFEKIIGFYKENMCEIQIDKE